MLLRSAASRSVLRSFISAPSSISRTPIRSTFSKAQLASPLSSVNVKRPQLLSLAAYRPISTSVQKYATLDGINRKHDEEEAAKKKLEANPDAVSVSSSTVPIIDLAQEKDIDMLKGVKADMVRTSMLF